MWVGRGILLHIGTQASRDQVSFHLVAPPLSRASESSAGFFHPVNKQGKRESMEDGTSGFTKVA